MPKAEKLDVGIAKYDTLQNQEKLKQFIKEERSFKFLCEKELENYKLYTSKYFADNFQHNKKVANIFQDYYVNQSKSNKELQFSFDFILQHNKIVYLVEVKNISDNYYKNCANYYLELKKYNALVYYKQRFEKEGVITKILNIFFNAYTKEYTFFEIDENTSYNFSIENRLMKEYTAFEGSMKVMKDVVLLNKYSTRAIKDINKYLNSNNI